MTATATVNRIKCDFSNRDLYNPVYLPLFRDNSEFLHLFGSAGSGKSRFAAQKEIALSFDWARRNRRTLVIRKVAETLKLSAYSELEQVINEWNLQDSFTILKSPLFIKNNVTGVEFVFKGLDDPEKIKSVARVDRVWIEEATELKTMSELDQLRFRLRGYSQVQIMLTYNPIDEFHWLNTEIHQGKAEGHRVFKTTYRDNIKLLAVDPNYGPALERTKDTNPNYYRIYALGEWGRVLEGLIFDKYEIVNSFGGAIQAYGLDFGYSNPNALVALRVEDATPKERLIAQEILYETGLDGPALARRFDELEIDKTVPIIADSARPEMIKTLKDAGYRVRECEKGAGSVLTGINRVREYDLCIVAGSKNGLRELQNYQKKQLADGRYLDEPAERQVDHFCDALRYGQQAFNIQPWTQTPVRFR